MEEKIHFNLNGKEVNIKLDSDRLLLWVLRTDFGLTGTKYGCGESYCGACTVLINGQAVRSCQTTMKEVQDKSVITIEGLAKDDRLHPMQNAFMENDALQCGYCTPGMIMNAVAFVNKNPDPTEKEILENMEQNLCRCGAHKRIVEAVQVAAKEMGGR
jgi:aerobic-type carbon monoxide dehydrogenase small subunit (CoxS/CutS family)